ncbi:ParA family protein [Amycolatopsis magusensis]|uniref:ParA family protein n=1 Tax=Amycolatopsis magusensis TaxID=882444 RepID=UPI0037A8BB31
MNSTTAASSLARQQLGELVTSFRAHLNRVVVFINGKGGAGKTTLTANLGGQLANFQVQAGTGGRILLIQLDHQGDLGLDLNFRGASGDDDGQSIVNVMLGAGGLNVLKDVRPNLDVIPAGKSLENVANLLKGSDVKAKRLARLRFVEAMANLAKDYEWVLVDCPPGDHELQVLGLILARWIIIPAQFDRASRYGLEGVNDAVEDAEELNPDMELLGVLMFAFDRKELRKVTKDGEVVAYREVGQRARVRKRLQKDLAEIGSDAPVFEAVISNNRAVAEDCREVGRLAAEVADASANPAWRKERRAKGLAVFGNDSAEALAADYEDAAIEIFTLAKTQEAAE